MLLGASAGPTIGGYLATLWGMRAPFYLYSLTGLISLVITFVWIREPEKLGEKLGQDPRWVLRTIKRLLLNRSYSMACLATFTVFFMRTGIRGTMVPLYADSILGFNKVTIGTIISYATIMNLIMTIPIGYAIDHFGRKPPIISSLLITSISSFIFPHTSDYLQISIASVLLGLGTSGAGQAPLALATDATMHEPHGLSMGLYRLFGDIGFVVGPIILGMIADGYGLRMPFFFMTVLILISLVLVQVFARETYRTGQ